VLPSRLFIQQSTWFLAGTRLAETVRTNVRTHNLSAASAKSRGEVIEPATEFLHGKQPFGNPALNRHNRAYKTRPRKLGNRLADAIDQGQIIQAVGLYGQYQRTVQVQKDRALLHLFWPSTPSPCGIPGLLYFSSILRLSRPCASLYRRRLLESPLLQLGTESLLHRHSGTLPRAPQCPSPAPYRC